MVILWAATNGYLDDVDVEKVRDFETKFLQHLRLKEKKLLGEIKEKKELDDKLTKALEKTVSDFKKTYGKYKGA